MTIPAIERHMSRLIIEQLADGTTLHHPLSIVEINRLAPKPEIKIFPFTSELPFTVYHDHPLSVSPAGHIKEL